MKKKKRQNTRSMCCYIRCFIEMCAELLNHMPSIHVRVKIAFRWDYSTGWCAHVYRVHAPFVHVRVCVERNDSGGYCRRRRHRCRCKDTFFMRFWLWVCDVCAHSKCECTRTFLFQYKNNSLGVINYLKVIIFVLLFFSLSFFLPHSVVLFVRHVSCISFFFCCSSSFFVCAVRRSGCLSLVEAHLHSYLRLCTNRWETLCVIDI